MKCPTLLALLDKQFVLVCISSTELFNRQMSSAKSPSTFQFVESIAGFVSSVKLIAKSKAIPNKIGESIQPCLTPGVILKVYVFPVQSLLNIAHSHKEI